MSSRSVALLARILGIFGCARRSRVLPGGDPLVGPVDTLSFAPFRTRTEPLLSGTVIYTAVGIDKLYVDWETKDPAGNRAREEWRKDEQYIYLDAYSGTTNGQRYPIFSYRTEINGVEVPSPPVGQIYMPRWITGPTTITVWGYLNANDGSFGKYWVWRHTLTPMTGVKSACGGVARKALKQQEVWWDSGIPGVPGGWLWNLNPSSPFNADNKPIPFTHQYTRTNYMGFDVGQAWMLYEYNKLITCIPNR